jgi:hypothetical protein
MAASTVLLLLLAAFGHRGQHWRFVARDDLVRGKVLALLLALLGCALSPSAAALGALQCAGFAAFGLASARVAQTAFLGLVLLTAQGLAPIPPGLLALAAAALLAAPVHPDAATPASQRAFDAALLRAPFVALLVHGGATWPQMVALVAAAVAGAQRECTMGPRPEVSALQTALRVLVRAAADTEIWVLGAIARLSVLGVVVLARGVVFAEDELTRVPTEFFGERWLRMTTRRASAQRAETQRRTDPGAR